MTTTEKAPTAESIHHALLERDEGAIVLDGFAEAFLGFAKRVAEPTVTVYSYEKMILAAMKNDGMTFDESLEFVDSIMDGLSGPQSPLIVVNPFAEGFIQQGLYGAVPT